MDITGLMPGRGPRTPIPRPSASPPTPIYAHRGIAAARDVARELRHVRIPRQPRRGTEPRGMRGMLGD